MPNKPQAATPLCSRLSESTLRRAWKLQMVDAKHNNISFARADSRLFKYVQIDSWDIVCIEWSDTAMGNNFDWYTSFEHVHFINFHKEPHLLIGQCDCRPLPVVFHKGSLSNPMIFDTKPRIPESCYCNCSNCNWWLGNAYTHTQESQSVYDRQKTHSYNWFDEISFRNIS